MKKIVSLLILLVLVFTLTSCTFTFIPYTTSGTTIEPVISKSIDKTIVKTVNFVSINDTHGQLYSSTYSGNHRFSIAEIDGAINYLEEMNNVEYIRIIDGDLFQGSYVSNMTRGLCLIDAANAADFDLMVLGNHEFDWGLETIHAYFDGDLSNGEADFPLLCANIIDKRTNERPDWIDPYLIIDYSGVKVGIIGGIGEDLESDIAVDLVSDYEFTSEVEAVKKYAQELRIDKKCDVIVYACHGYDSAMYKEISRLSSTYYIDAFIAGHTHQSINEYYKRPDGYNIPLIQSYTKNGNFGTISINLNSDNIPINATFSHYNGSSECATKSQPSDDCLAVEAKYQAIYDEGNRTIYNLKNNLNKQGVGDLMIEAMYYYLNKNYSINCAVGFLNSGGIRTNSVSRGNVTVSDVLEWFPFDNTIAYFKMKGSKLKEYYNNYSGSSVFYSGFNLSEINDNDYYYICTSDYVANSYKNNLINNYISDKKINYTEDIMYNVLIAYLEQK